MRGTGKPRKERGSTNEYSMIGTRCNRVEKTSDVKAHRLEQRSTTTLLSRFDPWWET